VVNLRIEREVDRVIAVVTYAQKVFGGDTAPADPPVFAPCRGLLDDLGQQ
jgi:hypothetical protein